MNNLFLFAAHNTVVALVFALFVYGLTRVWRNPPVAHVLWLLVLLKLVAPPVMIWIGRRSECPNRRPCATRSSLTRRESRGRRRPTLYRRSADDSNARNRLRRT